MPAGRLQARDSPNWVLVVIALILLIMAGYAEFKNRNGALIISLAFFALLAGTIAVFEPRAVGEFVLNRSGAKFNLQQKREVLRSLETTERELQERKLVAIDEVVHQGD
jgi:hypothetical protein